MARLMLDAEEIKRSPKYRVLKSADSKEAQKEGKPFVASIYIPTDMDPLPGKITITPVYHDDEED